MAQIRALHELGVLYVFAFLIGASVGSFLNVVIYRWPAGLSVVSPGSHCMNCQSPIPWYWNLPVVSWPLLRGRCRWCGSRISIRYFIIELLAGSWGVLALWRFGPGILALACFLLGAAFLAGSVIDLDHRLLPDAITLGAIPFGLGLALLSPKWIPSWPVRGWDSMIGAALGGGLFMGVIALFKAVTGREGMGIGDAKLMAGIGAVLGWQELHLVLILATVSGIAGWLLLAALKKADRNYPIPFGPFLCGAALLVLVLRPWLDRLPLIISL